MKAALGIIARPKESLMVLCLRPVIPHFDGLVILTAQNPEWKNDVASLVHAPRQFHVFENYKWVHDYADARNKLISHAESLGYDWMLMLDADESMLPDDIIILQRYLEMVECALLSRFEFVDNFEYFCPSFYPDYQARAFKLNMGYHYEGKLHEQLVRNKDGPARLMPYSAFIPLCPIYHYGKSKTPAETWLKYNAYERIAAGLPPFTEVPKGTVFPKSWALENKHIPFLGKKPL